MFSVPQQVASILASTEYTITQNNPLSPPQWIGWAHRTTPARCLPARGEGRSLCFNFPAGTSLWAWPPTAGKLFRQPITAHHLARSRLVRAGAPHHLSKPDALPYGLMVVLNSTVIAVGSEQPSTHKFHARVCKESVHDCTHPLPPRYGSLLILLALLPVSCFPSSSCFFHGSGHRQIFDTGH